MENWRLRPQSNGAWRESDLIAWRRSRRTPSVTTLANCGNIGSSAFARRKWKQPIPAPASDTKPFEEQATQPSQSQRIFGENAQCDRQSSAAIDGMKKRLAWALSFTPSSAVIHGTSIVVQSLRIAVTASYDCKIGGERSYLICFLTFNRKKRRISNERQTLVYSIFSMPLQR